MLTVSAFHAKKAAVLTPLLYLFAVEKSGKLFPYPGKTGVYLLFIFQDYGFLFVMCGNPPVMVALFPGSAFLQNPPHKRSVDLFNAAVLHTFTGSVSVLKVPFERPVKTDPAGKVHENDPIGLLQPVFLKETGIISVDHPVFIPHELPHDGTRHFPVSLLPSGRKLDRVQKENRYSVQVGQLPRKGGFSAPTVAENRNFHFSFLLFNDSEGLKAAFMRKQF